MDKKEVHEEINREMVDNQNTPMNSGVSKIKLIIGAILLFTIGVCIGYYFSRNDKIVNNSQASPSPIPTVVEKNDMEVWKEYLNEEYGFKLKYPSDWHEDVEGTSSDYVRMQNYTPSSIGRGYDPAVDKGKYSIQIYTWSTQNKPFKTIDELKIDLSKITGCINGGNRTISNELSSEKTNFITYSRTVACENSMWAEYYILNGKGLIVQIIRNLDYDANEFTDIFDQILSTFEFVN